MSRVLIACEYSGRVRDAFTLLGHDAVSCDLLPSETPGKHYQGSILDILGCGWDIMIAHPPCTYLSVSGLHWNTNNPERAQKTEEALRFVELIWAAPIARKALENPVGCISTRLPTMPRPQYIQPYDFQEDASKKTGLWLHNLPPLQPTGRIDGRMVCGKERWANQTPGGHNKLGPSEDRAHIRSLTYQGIAQAMAEQWGPLL